MHPLLTINVILHSLRLITALALSVTATHSVHAQTAPTDSTPKKPSFEQLMLEQGQRSREVMNRMNTTPQAAQSMPNIATPKAADVDPAELVKHYQQLKQAPERKEEGLFVMVSLSMPKASLARLVDESARYGFPLVLRGMVNDSWRDTMTAVQALIGNSGANVQIDPRLFTRFNTKVAPTTVVVSSATERWVAVQGDVTTAYALEKIAASNNPVKALAQVYLNRMKP